MSNYVKKIFQSVFLTSLCAPATVLSLSLLFDYKITWDFIALSFLLPLIIYSFDFFKDKYTKDRKTILLNLIYIAILLVSSSIIIINFGNLLSLILLAILLFLGLLYPILFKKFTRKYVGFKDIFVSICWNLAILMYFIYYSIPMTFGIILILIIIFIRDLINTSFCDIKDVDQDRKIGLKTYAVELGKKKLLFFIQGIGLISLVLLLTGYSTNVLPKTSILLVIPFLLTSLFVWISYKKNVFFEYIVDCEYLIWAIVFLIYKIK